MNTGDLNPYESPRSAEGNDSQPVSWSLPSGLLSVLRMAVVGYATFFGVAAIFCLADYYVEIQAYWSWALEVGGIGAMLFSATEVFKRGPGKKAGFLWRFVVTLGVFLLSGFVWSTLRDAFRWTPPRVYEPPPDPYWLHSLVMYGVILIAFLWAARLVWIGSENIESPKP